MSAYILLMNDEEVKKNSGMMMITIIPPLSHNLGSIRVLKIMGLNQPMRAWKQKGNTL